MERLLSSKRLETFQVPDFSVQRIPVDRKRGLIEEYLGTGIKTFGLEQCGVLAQFDGFDLSFYLKSIFRFSLMHYGYDLANWKQLPVHVGTLLTSKDEVSGPLGITSLVGIISAVSERFPGGILHTVTPLKDSVTRVFRGSFYFSNMVKDFYYHFKKSMVPLEKLPVVAEVLICDMAETVGLAEEYFGPGWIFRD
ncbi:hypothetical protein HYS10_02320 [Candidatus Collierbacteria bacterium]|nr:hypothetical protein [Candidatus Collierbacteria bacterium]